MPGRRPRAVWTAWPLNGRRPWELVVRDFGYAGGEVSVDVYYGGSGCPVTRRACFDEVQRLLRLRALPWLGLWPGGWDGGGIGGNPWPSVEATTMVAPSGRRFPSWRPCRGPIPFLIVIFIWAKALVPFAGDGGVPSSRSFLKASPGVPGSTVGALWCV